MRLAVCFAITLCLPSIAIAQDAPEKKCGAVAYVNDGTFAGAFNYENCTDAEAEAITRAVNVDAFMPCSAALIQ